MPRAINAAGQIAGEWGTSHAFIWSDGMVQDLGRLPGTDNCKAYAINDGGQVVGSCVGHGGGSVYQSFLWTADTGMTALPIPDWSGAMGINNLGHIVGWHSAPTSGAQASAFLYRDGVFEDLGPGHALAINDDDQVVGYGDDATERTSVARLWDDTGVHTLDDEGGESIAYAIRADGLIAGASRRGGTTYDVPFHAVLWTPYGISDLGTLRGGSSRAYAISGDFIVGESNERAFIYNAQGPGYAIDLNDLIAPSRHRLIGASAINAAGQIVGIADCCGETEAFLLTPVESKPPR
jgi:probable HAF family extracellular repeat protein